MGDKIINFLIDIAMIIFAIIAIPVIIAIGILALIVAILLAPFALIVEAFLE